MNPAAHSPSAEAVALLGRLTNEGCIQTVSVLMDAGFLHPAKVEQAARIVLGLADYSSLSAPAAAVGGEEMSPEFTDSARGAIAWVLWHHQGASSPIGQPLRFALGMGAGEELPDWRIAEAKRYAEWAKATTDDFHKANPAAPVVGFVVDRNNPPPNWCRTCGKHRDAQDAVFCSDAIHLKQSPAAQPSAKDGVREAVGLVDHDQHSILWQVPEDQRPAIGAKLYTHPVTPAAQESAKGGVRVDGAVHPMTAKRAAYFLHRFKNDEKLLGPNEQLALDYCIAMLEATTAAGLVDGVRAIITKLRERGERTKAQTFTGNADLLLANELEAAIGREVGNG